MAASTMLIGGRAVTTTGTVNGVATHTGQTYFFFAPLFIPFFILGVPIVDMAFAFVRRTANRTGFSTPDKNHLHHRLLRLGHGHRRSVLILWAWTVLLSGFILFPLYISSVNAVIPFGALALGVILYTLFHPSLRREAADPSAGRGRRPEALRTADPDPAAEGTPGPSGDREGDRRSTAPPPGTDGGLVPRAAPAPVVRVGPGSSAGRNGPAIAERPDPDRPRPESDRPDRLAGEL